MSFKVTLVKSEVPADPVSATPITCTRSGLPISLAVSVEAVTLTFEIKVFVTVAFEVSIS